MLSTSRHWIRCALIVTCLGCSIECAAAIVRYNDGIILQNFTVTTPENLGTLLGFLADNGQIRATVGLTDEGSIRGIVDTKYLKQVVGGFPTLEATPSRLASFAGYYSLAWVSNIVSQPGSWQRYEVNGTSQTAISPPILDPIKSYSASHYYKIKDNSSGLERPVPVNTDAFGDNHEPYYNHDWAVLNKTESLPGAYKNFYDRPGRPVGWFKPGESLGFRTELVAVDSNFDVTKRWAGIGVNFSWKTNGILAGDVVYDAVDEFEDAHPTLLGGGVFDIVQDFTVPGDYNDDGAVDAADYAAWRTNPSEHGGDPDGYNTWRASFGSSAAGMGRLANAALVPEPAGIALASIASLFLLRRKTFCRR